MDIVITKSQLDDLISRAERAEAEVASLRSECASLRAEGESLRAELEDANYTITKLRAAGDKILEKNASLKAELATVKAAAKCLTGRNEGELRQAIATFNAALAPASGNPAGPAGEGR